MKIAASVLLLAAVLLLSTTPVVTAAPLPVGGCPEGFELHEAMMHDMPGHRHVGLKVDLNGDGFICVLHATETIHVHIDNFVIAP